MKFAHIIKRKLYTNLKPLTLYIYSQNPPYFLLYILNRSTHEPDGFNPNLTCLAKWVCGFDLKLT
ncbi:hypothetical protein Hanom_Chr05g00411041 [Helianthus anomalus]